MNPNGAFFRKQYLKKVELHYNLRKLQSVEHDAVVRSEINGMFQTPRYQSDESRSIICCPKKKPYCSVAHHIHNISFTPIHSSLLVVGA
jgi:hypothetical protein